MVHCSQVDQIYLWSLHSFRILRECLARDRTFWSLGNSHYAEPFITGTVLHSKYRRMKVHKCRRPHRAELTNHHRPEMLKSENVHTNIPKGEGKGNKSTRFTFPDFKISDAVTSFLWSYMMRILTFSGTVSFPKEKVIFKIVLFFTHNRTKLMI